MITIEDFERISDLFFIGSNMKLAGLSSSAVQYWLYQSIVKGNKQTERLIREWDSSGYYDRVQIIRKLDE